MEKLRLASISDIIMSIMHRLRVSALQCTIAAMGFISMSPIFSGLVFAASSSISRSYNTNSDIVAGSLVSLDPKASTLVVPANRDNSDKLVGVAVGTDDSIVAINPGMESVQVAITGVVSALATTVNGPIKIGDQVAVSPFSGIGMATEPRTRIIGLAQSELNDNSLRLTEREVVDKDGKRQRIKVGYVQVNIAIGPPTKGTGEADNPSFLQRTTKSLTGKDISPTRIIIASFVAVIAIISLIVLIYSTIYATIISIGRNPLAKRAIYRTLVLVSIMALVTAGVALGSMYLILR